LFEKAGSALTFERSLTEQVPRGVELLLPLLLFQNLLEICLMLN